MKQRRRKHFRVDAVSVALPRLPCPAPADWRRDEFKRNKLDGIVTIKHCNAYVDGFGEALTGRADAVFLDLPQPWLAAPHAARTLRRGGHLCAFSPCVEQVHRTVAVLHELGFEGQLSVL